ncbi:MAG TPA: hypothetical protein VGP13_01945, partial [Candidatus Paceibacterota bacterium]|nr:hypothetical protein [Candidatus Paceibacterota bacterium]
PKAVGDLKISRRPTLQAFALLAAEAKEELESRGKKVTISSVSLEIKRLGGSTPKSNIGRLNRLPWLRKKLDL